MMEPEVLDVLNSGTLSNRHLRQKRKLIQKIVLTAFRLRREQIDLCQLVVSFNLHACTK
jgi:hypothetical protein